MFRTTKSIMFNLAIAVFGLLAVEMWQITPARFKIWTREDGPVEYATFGLYLAAALLMAVTARRTHRLRGPTLSLWAYAALFFVVAGEEISWGQRIFGFATPPELKTINVQGELTIHNINGLFQDVRMIGLAVVGIISFGIPILNYFSFRFRRVCHRFGMPVFPLWAGGATVAGMMFMALPRLKYVYGIQAMDEVGECLLSLAMFAFSIDAFRRPPLSRALDQELLHQHKPATHRALDPL